LHTRKVSSHYSSSIMESVLAINIEELSIGLSELIYMKIGSGIMFPDDGFRRVFFGFRFPYELISDSHHFTREIPQEVNEFL
jgi:hypothetical protein